MNDPLQGLDFTPDLSPEELAALASATEQHKAGNRELAALIVDYFKTLQESGATVELAEKLTLQLHGSYITSALNMGLLRAVASAQPEGEGDEA